MKSGTVLLVGRPNVGKSTLLNNLLHTKVSITSKQPQTTRSTIRGVYEDDRGQIIFIDTPGIFHKVENLVAKKVNQAAISAIGDEANLVLYVVDRARTRGEEENKVVGLLRKLDIPKILVVNKIDVEKPNHYAEYDIFADEFDRKVEISALKEIHLKKLIDVIFDYLPAGKPLVDTKNLVYPVLGTDSKKFLAELIREKVLLTMYEEIPHTVMVRVDEIKDKKEILVIIAKIITTEDKYKKMIIGHNGAKIKEIGSMARKEIEVASNKKVFLDLTVETDLHWPEKYL